MNFWVRNLIFAIILSVVAYFLLVNQDLLHSVGDTLLTDEPTVETTASDTTTVNGAKNPQAQQKKPENKTAPSTLKKSKNAAAEGLSRFYANLHGTEEGKGPRIRNNIVYLTDPKTNLTELLKAKAMVTRPLKPSWRGLKESRPFRTGSTLLQKLLEYAEQDGLDIIWRLNKDFIIKDPFRINEEILQTAYQIGKAVEGHFPDGLSVFFCNKQRTIVFIEGVDEYLTEECQLLTSKVPTQRRQRN